MQNLLSIVGERIKIARKNRGLTQTQFGKMVDLPQPYIGAIEKGEKNISIETLEKLANALELNPGDLFEPLKYDEEFKKSILSDKFKVLLEDRSEKEMQIIYKLILDVVNTIDALKKEDDTR